MLVSALKLVQILDMRYEHRAVRMTSPARITAVDPSSDCIWEELSIQSQNTDADADVVRLGGLGQTDEVCRP